MAEWKKVVVSGSAISQLANDVNYLSGAGQGIVSSSAFTTPAQGVVTASINGVETNLNLGLTTTSDVEFATITGSLKGNVVGDLTGTASFIDSDNVKFTGDNVSLTSVSTSFDARIALLETGTYDLQLIGDNDVLLTVENNETASFVGGEGIDTSGAGNAITIAMADNYSIAGSGSVGADFSVGGDLTVTGDLTVNGTTTTINTTNLNVEDKFILLSSGSTSGNDAGLVVAGQGASFGWDESENRWAFDFSGATADQTTITQDAFAAAVVITDDANYRKNGNIRVTAGEVFIYVE
jgi:hypothetical protein